MIHASVVTSTRATRLTVMAALLLSVGIGLSACSDSNPPKLPETSQAEQDKRDGELPAGDAAPAEAPQSADQSTDREPDADKPPPMASAPAPADAPKERGPATSPGRDRGGASEPGMSRGPASAAPSRPAAQSAEPGAGAAAPVTADTARKFDIVPVFYGTDRMVEPSPDRLKYGAERGRKLQIGQALITVPTAHKKPLVERPWVIEIPYFNLKVYEEKEDTAKHFTMQEISALTEEQMLALVKERLAKSATFKDHAFVFVHGFNTSFDNALYRTAQIAYDLKFDGAPFVYSWPSGGGIASYNYDRGSAEQAEPHLAQFLDLVVKKSGAKSISLIAHSMGNELLLRVLERSPPVTPEGVVISQVILAAPDVDRDKFANIAKGITTYSKGVTLYAASNDRALYYSRRIWGAPRAGDVPASGPTIVAGVDTIDVTAVSTDAFGLNHSGYAENPQLLDDVKALIQAGVRPPDKRMKDMLSVDSPTGVFWRYQATAAKPN